MDPVAQAVLRASGRLARVRLYAALHSVAAEVRKTCSAMFRPRSDAAKRAQLALLDQKPGSLEQWLLDGRVKTGSGPRCRRSRSTRIWLRPRLG
jgi:hypothetical protein